MSDSYGQGVATLGFSGGPSVRFRLNPSQVSWGFQVNTSVTETVGGRVVQVTGASISDLTVRGSFGERRGGTHVLSRDYAETFLAKMKEMAEYQSRSATQHRKMHEPAIFTFPPKGWRFAVYVKDLTDPDGGGSITHRPGKFSYDYVLTLMVHEDLSNTSRILGASNGDLTIARDRAIASYINRIADGIGWKASQYNGGRSADLAVAMGLAGTPALPQPQATNPSTGQRGGGAIE
jgi:hypothetical protein